MSESVQFCWCTLIGYQLDQVKQWMVVIFLFGRCANEGDSSDVNRPTTPVCCAKVGRCWTCVGPQSDYVKVPFNGHTCCIDWRFYHDAELLIWVEKKNCVQTPFRRMLEQPHSPKGTTGCTSFEAEESAAAEKHFVLRRSVGFCWPLRRLWLPCPTLAE